MSERFHVDAPSSLSAFLRGRLSGWHARTIRQCLRLGRVHVDGAVVTRGDHALRPGSLVEVAGRAAVEPRLRAPGVPPVLHADEDLIAIDKPAGLLSVSTEHERRRTALALLKAALSHPGRPARLWPVHRLDRGTSGVLLFARSHAAREAVQANWSDAHKVYLAVVAGRPRPAAGLVDRPLWEDARLDVHVGNGPGAKPARTRYRTLESAAGRSLLEVELETGRRHQIRAHLAWLGHPVVGDRRYGDGGPRLGLHARRLELAHPADGRRLVLEAPPPEAFLGLLRGRH
jgi:23S rRNA pseudouridine1911/1915/1917 synthase